jgi:sugar phosphate isomerase/epimerase
VRDQCQKDLPGTVAAVAKIGYKGIEFAGYYGRSAKELRQLLDDNGLVAWGTHTPYESVLPNKLKGTIEFNKVEMAFRAYDPCLGCATHSLPGHLSLQGNIYDRGWNLVQQLIQS